MYLRHMENLIDLILTCMWSCTLVLTINILAIFLVIKMSATYIQMYSRKLLSDQVRTMTKAYTVLKKINF